MLYKRGKTWWIDFTTPNGERIRRSSKTGNRLQAQEYHDKLKAEVWRQDKLKEQPDRTWDEAALRWLTSLGNPRTEQNAAIRLKWLQRFLRGKLLRGIDRTLLATIAEERGKEVGPSTVNRYLEMIRTVLGKAHEWGWLETVPPIKRQKEPLKRIRWLTHGETSRLLSELPGHQKDLAAFALATGLRQRNILELEWNQVDMIRKTCWIHPDQAKGGKAIGVPFHDQAFLIVERQRGKHERRVFTFAGKPIRQVNTKAWKNALKRSGISDFRWHDLRHTWASWHVQAGTPLNVLQELGGWSDFKMVQRYAHLAPEHLARFVENSKHVTIMAQPMLKIV